ncbi:hypothetical protein IEQ34_002038 [Dendrobium chrysotoxum]|uniref:Uncharacterized protein n=1 Tax=Dendrobium chrysotoxum TaxID=161865 RepID=A0AAV7HIN7_DENCH|nr:hypothetical protein IEQ34_002038 [Dendrobium chrysotoxum]
MDPGSSRHNDSKIALGAIRTAPSTFISPIRNLCIPPLQRYKLLYDELSCASGSYRRRTIDEWDSGQA